MPPAMVHPGLRPEKGVIPESTKRRLEQQYHPQNVIDPQLSYESNQPNRLHQLLGSRASSSPSSNAQPRRLPSRDVTDQTLDNAYVGFVMYCNPSVPLGTDVGELKKIFRSPPKSDGKNFNTFTLYELIRKLELKELKTWAQLALELGVEPPAFEKGQSAQKVQQYAVRLKRWMHAMHVDAFFEYLLNKAHIYWTQIPLPNDTSDTIRDGVPPEEDLALRALLPETRPKRGRRKAEDRDDGGIDKLQSQRPRLDSPTLSEDFMMARSSILSERETPATAHPDFQQAFHDRIVPWSATDTAGPTPGTFRWPPPDNTHSFSAYPQSAITPSSRTQLWSDEPQSAITPKSRARRRHGPAVSSAWPSNGSTPSGKVRGRPPSNRNVTDGPFSTFPANPTAKDVPTISLRNGTPSATPIVENNGTQHFFPPAANGTPATNGAAPNGRPSRLSLQVPQRQGGAVRLATPPPVVLVNGEGDTRMSQDLLPSQTPTPLTMEYFHSSPRSDPPQSSINISFQQSPSAAQDRTNIDALESHFISSILSASWVSPSGASIERCSLSEASQICKQMIKNLQVESSHTENFLLNLAALAGGPLMTRMRITRLEQEGLSHYECHWKMRFGALEGGFTIRASVHHESAEEGGLGSEVDDKSESSNWKKKYLELQQRVRERDKEVGALKRGVLNALVGADQFASV